MKRIFMILALVPTVGFSATKECPIRKDAAEGKVVLSSGSLTKQGVLTLQSLLEINGEEVPAIRSECTVQFRGMLCAHADSQGNRYDVFVRNYSSDLSQVRVGVVAWVGDTATSFEVKKECDPFSKWE